MRRQEFVLSAPGAGIGVSCAFDSAGFGKVDVQAPGHAAISHGEADFTQVPMCFGSDDGALAWPLPLVANIRPKTLMRVIQDFTRGEV